MKKKEYTYRKPKHNLWHNLLWILLLWLIICYLFNMFRPAVDTRNISYTEFKNNVRSGRVSEVTLKRNNISGKLKVQTASKQNQGKNVTNKASTDVMFATLKPEIQDPDLLPLLEKKDVIINVKPQEHPGCRASLSLCCPGYLFLDFLSIPARNYRNVWAVKADYSTFQNPRPNFMKRKKVTNFDVGQSKTR